MVVKKYYVFFDVSSYFIDKFINVKSSDNLSLMLQWCQSATQTSIEKIRQKNNCFQLRHLLLSEPYYQQTAASHFMHDDKTKNSGSFVKFSSLVNNKLPIATVIMLLY